MSKIGRAKPKACKLTSGEADLSLYLKSTKGTRSFTPKAGLARGIAIPCHSTLQDRMRYESMREVSLSPSIAGSQVPYAEPEPTPLFLVPSPEQKEKERQERIAAAKERCAIHRIKKVLRDS